MPQFQLASASGNTAEGGANSDSGCGNRAIQEFERWTPDCRAVDCCWQHVCPMIAAGALSLFLCLWYIVVDGLVKQWY